MAEEKFSQFVEDTAPLLTDQVVGLTGGDNKRMQIQYLTKKVQLDTGGGYAHSAGQLSYDAVSKTVLADTGFTDVRVNVGQELHVRFKNVSGVTITNGTVINAMGVDATDNVVEGYVADITSPSTSSAIIGVATADVLDGEVGVATSHGEVRDVNTSTLSVGGVLYASTGGGFTQTLPNYPNRVVILGTVIKVGTTDGIVQLDTQVFDRGTGSKSYSFTQANVGASNPYFYVGGFYLFETADTTLTQASLTQTFGTAGVAHASHAFAVFGGAGTVDAGQVGLRVNGTSFDDDGTRTTSDSEVLTTDITTLSLNQYLETTKKWLGTVTYELYEVAPAGTYSVDFNYGLAKYEDLGNLKFTVTGLEVVGVCGASDTTFDIELLHHKDTGWTYAATGFEAGDGTIATWSGDMGPDDNIQNGEPFAWKRVNLNQYIDGAGLEGVLWRITAGQNNSVQSMDMHLSGVIEQLVF